MDGAVTMEGARAHLMKLQMRLREGELVDDETLIEAVRLIRAGRMSASADKQKKKAEKLSVHIDLNDLMS